MNGVETGQRRRYAREQKGFGVVCGRRNLDARDSRKDAHPRKRVAGPGFGLKAGKLMLRELRLGLIVCRRHR